jgi:CDP-diacylglycerol--serine O-phosphatidyltransferase
LIALLITVVAGALMVSNFRYHSFKEFRLKERVPFVTLIIIVAISVVVLIDPATLLLFALLSYAVSGLVITLWGLKERRATRAKTKTSSSQAELSVTEDKAA